jgi:TolB-like protein/Flp pilus assembly protein TadD
MVLPHELVAALADRYVIERELGRGGMATVYQATDLKHQRPVALKVLKPELAAALGPERFLSEIQVTARLNHPHILALHDSGEAAGFLYYTMPLVAGESLRARLAREKQLAVDEALRVTEQVAGALDHAHRQSVIHRDIKPENILLHEGEALVADFGIALAVAASGGTRLTETGLSVGTPAYMSPEQIAGTQALDAPSDVYALGCVLYELLAGEPPFTGATVQAVLARHLTDPVPPLATVRTEVPAAVVAAVTKALAKSPADRFATAGAFAKALRAPRPEVASEVKSIVVLPFANLSPDPENEYFADGLTEEIITDLSQVRSLHVISRNSAMQLKGTRNDTKAIGRELGVRYVLEGSVRRAASKLRITAQLVDAETDAHLWANKFSGTVDDVFDVQESVSRSIVDRLALELTPAEERRLAGRAAGGSAEAYDLYLLGRYHMNQFTREELHTAIDYFGRSVELQPGFAKAHAGLADSYILLTQGPGEPPLENFPRARAAALTALQIDPSLEDAHTSLGGVHLFFDWDFERAEAGFRRAIELNANYGQAHHWLALSLYGRGRHDEARQPMDRALALDPLAPYVNLNASYLRYAARDYDGALVRIRRAIEIHPGSPGIRMMLGIAHMALEQWDAAIAELERAWWLSHGEFLMPLMILGYSLARAGRASEARKLLKEMEQTERRRFVNPDYFAIVHIGLGEYAEAFNRLEQATDARTDWPLWFPVDPMTECIRAHPRYLALLDRIGLSAPAAAPLPLAARSEQPAAAASHSTGTAVEGFRPDDRSIVVLPFENLSPDPENAFLADGLAEEIITDLSRIQGLLVISRNSARALRETKKTTRQIARDARVRYVLRGGVRRAGTSLRITAQLVDAETEDHIWADRFTGTLEEIFDIQEEVSRAVVEALEIELTAEQKQRLQQHPIGDPRAFECYLRARQEYLHYTEDSLARAIALIEQGLRTVGENAPLLALLGQIYWAFVNLGIRLDAAYLDKADECAKRGFEVDSGSAWGYHLLGLIAYKRGDIQASVKHAKKALALEPSNADALDHLLWMYADAGRMERSEPLMTRLLEIDPFTPHNHWVIGWTRVMRGEVAAGLPWFTEAYEMEPGNPIWRMLYAHQLYMNRRNGEADLIADEMAREAPGSVVTSLTLFLRHVFHGEGDAALRQVTDDVARFGEWDEYISWLLAQGHALLDARANALRWLENAVARGLTNYPFLVRQDPFLENIRGDPRFRQLMERVRRTWETFEV